MRARPSKPDRAPRAGTSGLNDRPTTGCSWVLGQETAPVPANVLSKPACLQSKKQCRRSYSCPPPLPLDVQTSKWGNKPICSATQVGPDARGRAFGEVRGFAVGVTTRTTPIFRDKKTKALWQRVSSVTGRGRSNPNRGLGRPFYSWPEPAQSGRRKVRTGGGGSPLSNRAARLAVPSALTGEGAHRKKKNVFPILRISGYQCDFTLVH